MLLACGRGEPGAFPRCKPGYLNYVFGVCYKQCGAGKPACAANESCEGDEGYKLCIPQ